MVLPEVPGAAGTPVSVERDGRDVGLDGALDGRDLALDGRDLDPEPAGVDTAGLGVALADDAGLGVTGFGVPEVELAELGVGIEGGTALGLASVGATTDDARVEPPADGTVAVHPASNTNPKPIATRRMVRRTPFHRGLPLLHPRRAPLVHLPRAGRIPGPYSPHTRLRPAPV